MMPADVIDLATRRRIKQWQDVINRVTVFPVAVVLTYFFLGLAVIEFWRRGAR